MTQPTTLCMHSWPQAPDALKLLAWLLALFSGLKITLNAYGTVPNSDGLSPHSDSHDIYVGQLWGSKRWRLPLDRSTTLSPGSILYLPAFTPHSTHALSFGSVHCTLGIHTASLIPT
jgi:hypothetical protein